MTPSYNGLPWTTCPLMGLVQSFVPVAKPVKFVTAFGALAGNNSHRIVPIVVWMIALGDLAEMVAGGVFLGAALGCADAVGDAVCARAARLRDSRTLTVR